MLNIFQQSMTLGLASNYVLVFGVEFSLGCHVNGASDLSFFAVLSEFGFIYFNLFVLEERTWFSIHIPCCRSNF